MLQRAVDRFAHKAIAIRLANAAGIAFGDHIKAFGIGIVARQGDAGMSAESLLRAAAIVLVAI